MSDKRRRTGYVVVVVNTLFNMFNTVAEIVVVNAPFAKFDFFTANSNPNTHFFRLTRTVTVQYPPMGTAPVNRLTRSFSHAAAD